ncbi:lipoyl(octanoyl) transferase LipB [Hellea balneolensis]|uniref:lipoyl(octanoyl) transferase LipB n=1 Tax=Hellea balneolensis TaxID=287478 RepID=UPI000555FD4C|nr:lipoyl(octanoyl) transferase LipB [Hellea balneolensis]
MSKTSKIYASDRVEWRISDALEAYPEAAAYMENRAKAIAAQDAAEQIWLLEHPPLYSAGTSAKKTDLVEPDRFDVFESGRGGQYTYHGPGQRVGYVMLDLRTRGRDVAAFVRGLEQWIIDTLAEFDVTAERRCGRVGVWVVLPDGREAKIAAIGVRLKKWVSFHGISINLNPDLSHFGGIIPCGIQEHGVTSLQDLGKTVSMDDLDKALKSNFEKIFAPTEISA